MKKYQFDYTRYQPEITALLSELQESLPLSSTDFLKIVRKYSKNSGNTFSKTELLSAYLALCKKEPAVFVKNESMIRLLQMKPVRTVSGVAPVTVLTKPFPCPGKCIFCPSDVRMPKSYLSDEPGAQRAERNYFDPYLQTHNRLSALSAMGHVVDKVELIILGGTWSFYSEKYQIWFVKECFRALNEFGVSESDQEIRENYRQFEKKLDSINAHAPSDDPEKNKHLLQEYSILGSDLERKYNHIISEVYTAPEKKLGIDAYQSATWKELEIQQEHNESALIRNVGLVIETRPDSISEKEVIRIRRLGCTKTQIGIQSLQDDVLHKNNRGHTVNETRQAFALLRRAGFKIHAHWMANLYGSSVEKDIEDYEKLFSDPSFKPDELKLYPCSLIESAELMQYYKDGRWQPYSHDELLKVLSYCLMHTPPYCRLTRVIRDIPSQDIVAGNKKSNFRQIAEQSLEKIGKQSKDIRAREIRRQEYDHSAVEVDEIVYETSVSTEHFLQVLAPAKQKIDSESRKDMKLLGFLRLSIPKKQNEKNNSEHFIPELQDVAIIREVHVYGKATMIGKKRKKTAQHRGFGTQLIERAKEISKNKGFHKLAVISAIGTKEYYRKRGFVDDGMYQIAEV